MTIIKGIYLNLQERQTYLGPFVQSQD